MKLLKLSIKIQKVQLGKVELSVFLFENKFSYIINFSKIVSITNFGVAS